MKKLLMKIRLFTSVFEVPPRTAVTKDSGDATVPTGRGAPLPPAANGGNLWEINNIDAAFIGEALRVVWMDNLNTKLPLIQIIGALAEDKGSNSKTRETTPA